MCTQHCTEHWNRQWTIRCSGSFSLKYTMPVWDRHYYDVIMSGMASQIAGVSIVYLTFCSAVDEKKYQSSASMAFVRGIHRWPVNSPHIGPVTRKMFPFDNVIISLSVWLFGLVLRSVIQYNKNDTLIWYWMICKRLRHFQGRIS